MRQRKPRTVTVQQKLRKSNHEITITEIKRLDGSLLYFDWKKEYPNLSRPEKEVCYQGTVIKLYEFPPMFEKKIESKISFHFARKLNNLQIRTPKYIRQG